MNSLSLSMIAKNTPRHLTAVLLAVVGCAIVFVACMLYRHHAGRTRKKGSDIHDGHHGNH